jgi:hypothetical protein
VGSYVFGDFCTGEIFVYQGGTASLLLDSTLALSAFGEDEAGELYVVGIAARSIASSTIVGCADFNGDGRSDLLAAHVRRRPRRADRRHRHQRPRHPGHRRPELGQPVTSRRAAV